MSDLIYEVELKPPSDIKENPVGYRENKLYFSAHLAVMLKTATTLPKECAYLWAEGMSPWLINNPLPTLTSSFEEM